MRTIIETYKNTGTLHHGYCIEGDRNDLFTQLCLFIENDLKFVTKGNSDFWVGEYDSFGIDESRKLKELHAVKSFREDSRKIFILQANFITHEAQNALLKMFEEPGQGNHFFILMPSADALLPTLKSRLQIVTSGAKSNDTYHELAKRFIKATVSDRLEIVKELTAAISDDEKSKVDAIAFIHAIERLLRDEKKPEHFTTKDIFLFEEIARLRSYLSLRSSSVKMILEHLSLIFQK